MQYNININQKELIDINDNFDLSHGAIISYIHRICSSQNQRIAEKRVHNNDGVWTWVDYEKLIKELPLLNVKSKGTITSRIKDIKKAGLIETERFNNQKLYIKQTPLFDKLFTQMNTAVHSDEQPHNNINNNTNNKDNNKESLKEYIRDIYTYYQERIHKRSRLTNKARRKIKTRLKELKTSDNSYEDAVDILKKAILRFSRNKWRMENNSRNGLSWFFHSEDRIDKFLNLKQDMKKKTKLNLPKELRNE